MPGALKALHSSAASMHPAAPPGLLTPFDLFWNGMFPNGAADAGSGGSPAFQYGWHGWGSNEIYGGGGTSSGAGTGNRHSIGYDSMHSLVTGTAEEPMHPSARFTGTAPSRSTPDLLITTAGTEGIAAAPGSPTYIAKHNMQWESSEFDGSGPTDHHRSDTWLDAANGAQFMLDGHEAWYRCDFYLPSNWVCNPSSDWGVQWMWQAHNWPDTDVPGQNDVQLSVGIYSDSTGGFASNPLGRLMLRVTGGGAVGSEVDVFGRGSSTYQETYINYGVVPKGQWVSMIFRAKWAWNPANGPLFEWYVGVGGATPTKVGATITQPNIFWYLHNAGTGTGPAGVGKGYLVQGPYTGPVNQAWWTTNGPLLQYFANQCCGPQAKNVGLNIAPPSGVQVAGMGAVRNSTAAATSHAIPYPAQVAANDFLVMLVSTNGGSVVTPTGWTAAYNEGTVASVKGGLFYRVASGTEGGTSLTITTASTTLSAVIVRLLGVNAVTPLDTASISSFSSGSTGTGLTLPQLTTVTAGAVLIYGCGLNNTGNTVVSSSYASELIDFGTILSAGKSGALYMERTTAVGATGTKTMTLSAARARWGAMIALRPG